MYGGDVPPEITGTWVYRSYLNRPDVMVGGDPAKALSLLFGEGVMTFDVNPGGTLKGNLDMGGNMVLDLAGTIRAADPAVLRIAGIGRPGTPTDGWEYDYVGYLAETWPKGIDQVPAVVGTVIRTKPHGGGKAGVTASFIAVKKP
jgi:hypothetical protein